MSEPMVTPDSAVPDLSDTAARRRDLRAALVDLEAATTAPGSGAAWAGRARLGLAGLQEAFAAHVGGTEASDGIFAEVMAQAPHLAHRISHLRQDHDAITAQIEDCDVALGAVGDPTTEAAAHEKLFALIGALSRHRHLGAVLVWDAFDTDISAGD